MAEPDSASMPLQDHAFACCASPCCETYTALHACLCCSSRMVAALLDVHTMYMHELLHAFP